MLIGFIGTPCSGKTTIAAKMFANFKENGTNCELIVEIARGYIAKLRYDNKNNNNYQVNLTDEDQLRIAIKQLEIEKMMKFSCGTSTIVVSDSCSLNAGLYMSDSKYRESEIQKFFSNCSSTYDLLFYCHPIEMKELPEDPNRVHDLETIKSLNYRASDLLKKIKSFNKTNIVELFGTLSLTARFNDACSTTLNQHLNLIQRS